MVPRALQHDVSAPHIRSRELEGVAERQVDVRLRRKVDYRIDFISLQGGCDVCRFRDVALHKGEIREVIEGGGVIEGSAVLEFVEGNYAVGIGVLECEMAY